jgi:nucleotide-binding universal stress UspA family protein
VHACQSPYASAGHRPDDALVPAATTAAAEATAVLTELLAAWQAKFPDVTVGQDVVHGNPGRVLADYSARADLVVLGRHGERSVARVSHAVLSHAHGPVATVPSP